MTIKRYSMACPHRSSIQGTLDPQIDASITELLDLHAHIGKNTSVICKNFNSWIQEITISHIFSHLI